jgi:hypothetical protein
MLRRNNSAAIRKPVHHLYTVANHLLKEHAELARRRASDINEVNAAGAGPTLPE